ncbi:hypothetical protein Y1Q_0002162 [Alligator mississippiensis]|uniref:Secreted protein n=1 Tax=Alligator mississippiensis TaxID=8496 RepID=A0A151MPR3_ALLMI|nr:hypothetical protein Y1Q_0002162 [Alligator mississippiensis]
MTGVLFFSSSLLCRTYAVFMPLEEKGEICHTSYSKTHCSKRNSRGGTQDLFVLVHLFPPVHIHAGVPWQRLRCLATASAGTGQIFYRHSIQLYGSRME